MRFFSSFFIDAVNVLPCHFEDRCIIYESTLVKWGNSVGLALLKPIRDGMKLKSRDKLKIVLQDNKICIERI
jgi:hypothetical protein